jgi:exopolysaccharide production protein ExoY
MSDVAPTTEPDPPVEAIVDVRDVEDLSPPSLVVVPDLDRPAEGEAASHGSAWDRAVKRAMDIVGSVVLLVLLLPVALLIALAIAVESRGPVVFVQKRAGRGGKPFSLVKFRTMVRNGDAALAEALANDEELRREWEQWRKLRHDPRVTRVGRFLRRFSLDELPQILNVLIGNMSLVGPRPVMEDELRYFGDLADAVLAVRPGLTGRWAVSGRSEVSYAERVELEYDYATTWSPLGDIGILLRTIPAVFRGHGAY